MWKTFASSYKVESWAFSMLSHDCGVEKAKWVKIGGLRFLQLLACLFRAGKNFDAMLMCFPVVWKGKLLWILLVKLSKFSFQIEAVYQTISFDILLIQWDVGWLVGIDLNFKKKSCIKTWTKASILVPQASHHIRPCHPFYSVNPLQHHV